MENLARYIIRASFLQERINYIREESKVIYKSKDGTNTRQFDAVDFISALQAISQTKVNRWSGIMALQQCMQGLKEKR
ncbi:hypothetical protein ES703_19964 [subsurface metagenome]